MFLAATVADPKIFFIHVLDGHADAGVGEHDGSGFGIDANIPGLGVRVPSVGDSFGQHGSHVAVEIDPEMFEGCLS